jgi:deoxyribodipyrimidine photo-lyase
MNLPDLMGPRMASTAIVWFRNDLRLADSPALSAACASAERVLPVFIWHPAEHGKWAPGAASRAWLARSLESLRASLAGRGGTLLVRSGEPSTVLAALAAEVGASTVYWNRRYEPALAQADAATARALDHAGLSVRDFPGTLLHEPGAIFTGAGSPYRVFTPFWRTVMGAPAPDVPLRAPTRVPAPECAPANAEPESLLEPGAKAPPLLDTHFAPGENGAHARAARFFAEIAEDYDETRDRPDVDGTSRLSPHLAFGEISARTLWHDAHDLPPLNVDDVLVRGAAAFVRQLVWRDFAAHLLAAEPHTTDQPLRPEFRAFPWRSDPAALETWQRGMTGYPIVDAGMRELAATGWMHNRVRMVVASFFTKDLLLPWQAGARWFWERLVDADLANNTFGWQWVAGLGADAAPYFRIFNPASQAERYDPDGAYVRQWVPELGTSAYPPPMIDHGEARTRALAAYEATRAAR